MSFRNTDRQWGSVAKFFHWTIALLIIGNGIFGLCMDLASNPMQKINWLALHKSIGLTVLALFLLRVLWRFFNRQPKDEPAPRWQHIAAMTGKRGSFTCAKSALCDARLRTPKKLQNTMRIIFKSSMSGSFTWVRIDLSCIDVARRVM